MKTALFALIVLFGCQRVVDNKPEVPKLEIKLSGKRIWNMEQGPYTLSAIFNNRPEEDPVCLNGYICYSFVNNGNCGEENLRFHADGILRPYAQMGITFTLQDYIYAEGLRDEREIQDFFNQRSDRAPDAFMTSIDPESMSGEVILELRAYELVLNDRGEYESGKILARARHVLVLDCTYCGN